jgi:hypothetical protein
MMQWWSWQAIGMDMMPSKFKKITIAWALAGGVALALIAWFPVVHYYAYRSGLLEPAVLAGHRIAMKPGWYPALSSQSMLGRHILSGGDKVWMVKAEWPRWGIVNSLVISTMGQHSVDTYKAVRANGAVPPSISEIKPYAWGSVAFTVLRTSAVVEDLWLFLSDDDPVLLRHAIDEIEGFYPV